MGALPNHKRREAITSGKRNFITNKMHTVPFHFPISCAVSRIHIRAIYHFSCAFERRKLFGTKKFVRILYAWIVWQNVGWTHHIFFIHDFYPFKQFFFFFCVWLSIRVCHICLTMVFLANYSGCIVSLFERISSPKC